MSRSPADEALRRAAIAMVPTDPWLQHERQRCLDDADNPKVRLVLITDPDYAWATRRPFRPHQFTARRRPKSPAAA